MKEDSCLCLRWSLKRITRSEPIFTLGKTGFFPAPYKPMGARQVPLNGNWRPLAPGRPSANVFRPSQLRKMRGSEQVAAVCYRITNRGTEFLLVQTRGSRRWTFPKGGTEPGLTSAQAAALEAFEEAGVHGRIEEIAFARYFRHQKRGKRELTVHAHLCEVTWLDKPQESGRNPTWFCIERAKRHLRLNRSSDSGEELVRVLDRAFFRIQRLQGTVSAPEDTLQKVRFEGHHAAAVDLGIHEGSFFRYFRSQRNGERQFAAIELAVRTYLGKALRLGMPRELAGNPLLLPETKPKRLLTRGTLCNQVEPLNAINNTQKITAIDKASGKGKGALPNKKKF